LRKEKFSSFFASVLSSRFALEEGFLVSECIVVEDKIRID